MVGAPARMQNQRNIVDAGRVASAQWSAIPSLPRLLPFVWAWAAGETVAYIAGPGDALSRVT
jgi:hypothetical protein